MGKIFEALSKTFLNKPEEITHPSNNTDDARVIKSLSDEPHEGTMVFNNLDSHEWSYSGNENTLLKYQSKVIESYRSLAKDGDVSYAIDLLTNEMAFTTEKEEFKINIDEENSTIKDKIGDVFQKVQSLLNTKDNIHSLCRQMYIDGQLNIALVYDKNNTQAGIKKVQIIEPFGLYFDKDNNVWKYAPDDQHIRSCLYNTSVNDSDSDSEEYSNDEMVHVDYGLTSKIILGEDIKGRVNLGYLENAQKAANQLNTLENMLVPMRYSRSVSRRMFNIDVADLPPKKAKELMDKIRAEFKYKKTYNTEDGTIRSMQATQPLVEDYWMSNRGGSRGTTVDTMDEKGGLMDLEDIIHASKKLFTSMKIPSSRNPYVDENGGDFSYDTDNTTNEDMMFYLHVDRLRIPITNMFKEILKREIIATGVMSEQEWDKYAEKINIEFTSKSIFLENMEKDLFIKSIGNWVDIKEEVGVMVSLETAVSTVFGWSNEKLQKEMERIKEETNNPLYRSFYSSREDGF